MTGIAPDAMHEYEQGENTEKEKKLVRKQLITFYETHISTILKAELCSVDISSHNNTKEASTSKFYETSTVIANRWHNLLKLLTYFGF